MSRFGLLFALLSLLFVSSFAAVDDETLNLNMTGRALGAGYKSATWTARTMTPAWEPRAGGVVEWYSGSVRTNSGARTGNWLLMYGAGIWTCWDDCAAKNEVWASADQGRTWTQITPRQEFSPLMSPQTVQDNRGWQYRIQGTDYDRGCNGGGYGDVFVSSDGGYNWVRKAEFPTADGETRYLGTAVVDSQNYIYVLHGQSCGEVLNDVWVSTNQASTWKPVVQRGRALPPGRSVHGSVVGKYYDPTSKAAVDAIYIMYGYLGANENGNTYRNDIWVSTTGASSWVQITDKAQWSARGDSQLEVTASGVLVIAGGVQNIAGLERRQLNDVWASLDGGWTWGICSDNAKWDDRVFPYTAIDSDGKLYVMGGLAIDEGGDNRLVNDVWVSGQSFNDPATVADMCGLIVPPCGVGLRCMPGDMNLVQGNWGVSCDACPWQPLAAPAASSTSMIMTYLFVAFLLISLLLAAILGYIIYRSRQSGSSTIALPGSAQRWWNDKPQTGLTDELNKGNTASDYNPLSIRDQM